MELTEEINKIYPPDEWMIKAGHPPVKAWYKIQDMAYNNDVVCVKEGQKKSRNE